MPDMPLDIVFLDTETLGLDPDAPIWEFAAVRRCTNGGEDKTEFQIRHDATTWLDAMPDQFLYDYDERYKPHDAATESDAAVMMHILTKGAVVIGCNPSFDLERIAKLITKHGMTPEWHYRPVCVTTMGAGYLLGFSQRTRLAGVRNGPIAERTLPVPWSSDDIAGQLGVESGDYARHTAMGDVLWTIAQWDAVMGATGRATR